MYLRSAFSLERKKNIVKQYGVSVGLGVWRLNEVRVNLLGQRNNDPGGILGQKAAGFRGSYS